MPGFAGLGVGQEALRETREKQQDGVRGSGEKKCQKRSEMALNVILTMWCPQICVVDPQTCRSARHWEE